MFNRCNQIDINDTWSSLHMLKSVAPSAIEVHRHPNIKARFRKSVSSSSSIIDLVEYRARLQPDYIEALSLNGVSDTILHIGKMFGMR